MRQPVRMPRLGLTMEMGTVARWAKKPGERVRRGEVLLEVETDKTRVDVMADVEGILVAVMADEGAEIAVGEPIAEVEVGEDESNEGNMAANPAGATQPAVAPRLRISPAARRQASRLGLDAAAVRGSGPGGRVELRDLSAVGVPPTAGPTEEPVAGLSSTRRGIARRVLSSWRDIPQFTVSRRIGLTKAEAALALLRNADLHRSGVRLTLTDFLILALAAALHDTPAFRSRLVGNPDDPNARVITEASAHIAIAVATPEGVIAPVLRNADTLGLSDIASKRADLAARARAGRLRPEELEGAVFTLSNLGPFGVHRFTALVNPPESGVLAVGAAEGPGREAEFALSADHRLVDGADGARLLAVLASYLEGGTA